MHLCLLGVAMKMWVPLADSTPNLLPQAPALGSGLCAAPGALEAGMSCCRLGLNETVGSIQEKRVATRPLRNLAA